MSERDPVAWLVMEPGWKVVDSNDNEIGRVEEIVGDPNADIFNGLLISTGLFHGARYIPAEQIDGITEGRVRLRLDRDELKRLPDDAPPGPA